MVCSSWVITFSIRRSTECLIPPTSSLTGYWRTSRRARPNLSAARPQLPASQSASARSDQHLRQGSGENMSSTVVQLPNAATAAAQSPAIAITRVRFLAEVAPEAKVLRVFREPWPCFAVEEAAEPGDLARQQLRQEATDQLIVVLIPGAAAAEAK